MEMIEIILDLDQDLAKKLEKIAQKQRCTPSDYISKFLIEYIEQHTTSKNPPD